MKTSAGNSKSNRKNSDDWLNPNKVIGNAQRILTTAVDVLEEEIAAGILAAKKLEKKVIDVDEVRGNPEQLMSRLRKDTHEALDILWDAITVLTNHIKNLSQTVAGKEEKEKEEKANVHHIPIVKNETPVKAGEKLELPVMLTNDSTDYQLTVELVKCDLQGTIGNKIGSRFITITPRQVVLAPGEKKEALITVAIPSTIKPGNYSGLFQDNHNPQLRTVISVNIE